MKYEAKLNDSLLMTDLIKKSEHILAENEDLRKILEKITSRMNNALLDVEKASKSILFSL